MAEANCRKIRLELHVDEEPSLPSLTQRPVTAFVSPIRAGRYIESPAHAAHFVSLLAHTREHEAGAAVEGEVAVVERGR